MDEDGMTPRYDPDELSAEGSAGPEAEVERVNSPSASPKRELFNKSPKVKTRKRRLVIKSIAEDHPQLDDVEEKQSRPSKRKSRDLEETAGRKRFQTVREGREGKETEGRGPAERKKGKLKVGYTASKLANLERSSCKDRRNRVADPDRFQRSRDHKEEKYTRADPAASKGSKKGKELKPGTLDDDMFMYDRGIPYHSDDDLGEHATASPSHTSEVEKGEENETDKIDDDSKFLLKLNRKKKISHKQTSEEVALFAEQFLAKLDVAAKADADLNRASKPAIEKLKMLPKLLNVLEKRQLQEELLDRGLLSSLKTWLEPLPDGSLPNRNIRSALLKLLTDLPIDTADVFGRRQQLKKSRLGKVVMFLSRLPEETPVNKKLARDLVEKWSRSIFQKSTRYEDLRRYDDECPRPRRLPVKKPVPKPRLEESTGEDEFEPELNQEKELLSGHPVNQYRASRPEALPMDFVIRPASKIDGESVRALPKPKLTEERRSKMNKKLQQLTKPKRKTLQATRLNVHGK